MTAAAQTSFLPASAAAVSAAENVPPLTGLRALAAYMVLSLHLDQIHGNPLARFVPVIGQGNLGVDVFFVLSGYILSHVYAQPMMPMEWRPYLKFLWRRISRIYPVHIFVLAALIGMVSARHLLNTNFWIVDDLPRHLLLLQAWTDTLTWNLPSWSISAEWLAYVLFPAFTILILRPTRIWLAIAAVAAILAVPRLAGSNQGVEFGFFGWPALVRVTGEFALGMFVFRLMKTAPPSAWFDLIACVALVAFLAIPWALAKIVVIAIFVAAVAGSTGPVRSLLSSRIAVFLGTVSYSIYMVHFPLAKLIQNFNLRFDLEHPSPLLAVVLIIGWSCVITAFAIATYWVIERPARNWCRAQEGRLF